MEQKIGILIQARLSSSRLPGKMLMKINHLALVQFVFLRCLNATSPDMVSVITSEDPSDDAMFLFCRNHQIPVFRGALENVLDRYIQAAKVYNLDYIIRVCGDSPFVDTVAMDQMVHQAVRKKLDYISLGNTLDGFVSEVISIDTLNYMIQQTNDAKDLEHVTRFVRCHMDRFKTEVLKGDIKTADNHISITVDTLKDFKFCNKIANTLMQSPKNRAFGFSKMDVLRAIEHVKGSIAV